MPVNKNYCFARLNVTETEAVTEESEFVTEEIFDVTTERDLDVLEEVNYVPMVCDAEKSKSNPAFVWIMLACE